MEFGKLDKMSHKDAKAWLKEHMEQTGCSKKEAKEAFKEQFGYSYPLSFGQKFGRRLLTFLSPLPGVSGGVAVLLDKSLDGKLGIKKFASGQGNNDATYIKRDTVE